MPIMTEHAGEVIGGVDTHGEAHHAAVIDTLGRTVKGHPPSRSWGTSRLPRLMVVIGC